MIMEYLSRGESAQVAAIVMLGVIIVVAMVLRRIERHDAKDETQHRAQLSS